MHKLECGLAFSDTADGLFKCCSVDESGDTLRPVAGIMAAQDVKGLFTFASVDNFMPRSVVRMFSVVEFNIPVSSCRFFVAPSAAVVSAKFAAFSFPVIARVAAVAKPEFKDDFCSFAVYFL